MKKKLLFNLTEDWFFCSHFLNRALTAKKNGFSVYVCSKENNHKSIIESYGIKFIPLPYNRKNINPFYELYVLVRIIFLYKNIKPDITHNIAAKPIIYGSIASKICNIKSVINAPVGMGFIFTSESLKAKILRPILKLLMKSFLNTHHGKSRKTKVIFENNDDLKYFINLGALSKDESCVIRGAGVKVKKSKIKRKSSSFITVTLVARMIKDKGIYEFVSAAKKLKKKHFKVKFLLAGDIDSLNPSSLKKQTLNNWHKEGIITWLGWVDNVDMVLDKTDILCLPSYREGLPKALIEGAAKGLPIVTTNTVGCKDVVENGVNGFLVPVKNVKELSSKISKLIKSKVLREKMGKESLRIASSKFCEKIINSQTLDIYNELVN